MEEIFKELEGGISLQQISIIGLFGKFDYDISFENPEGVTILYGLNGIGKTTILKIIYLIKEIDFTNIFKFPFKKIELELYWFNQSNKKYNFSILLNNLDKASIKFSIKGEGINVSYTTPHIDECEVVFKLLKSKFPLETPIDEILTSDFVKNDKEIMAQVMMLLALLSFKCNYIESLRNNINRFEVLDEYYQAKIVEYKKLEERIPKLVDLIDKEYDFKPEYTIDVLQDIMNYFFDKKLELISEHLRELNPSESKEDIELFENTINKFFDFKSLKILKERGISILLEDNEELPLSKLSSGENNLIVIFYQIIFNTDENSLVMIDEPEISLNINWHYDFIDTLREIRKEKKIRYFIATHSPQIVNDYTQNCVDAKYKEKKPKKDE